MDGRHSGAALSRDTFRTFGATGSNPSRGAAARGENGVLSWFRAIRSGAAVEVVAPLTFLLADDGVIPNNPALPLVIYRRALAGDADADLASAFEDLFARHGWRDSWRDGIFPYAHYHSGIHEVLGVACGHARVRFGGANGTDLTLGAGDVAVLPAGTGHQRLLASDDFLVVGAYPAKGEYDLCRERPEDRRRALVSIPKVPLPACDPVFGADGPLMRLWR